MTGPYRAEHGAIHHEDTVAHFFTVSPPDFAADVAHALNAARVAPALLEALEGLANECEAEFTLDGKWVSDGQLVSRATYEAARSALNLARGGE
jgi:hypothetical protein